jgi:hypothetical protein
MGLRGVSDLESIGYYENISDEKKEFARKVRTVLRGISVFMKSLSLLNPLQYGLFSWQLLSHKLCRWLVPFALILAFLSNVLLTVQGTFYFIIFLFQAAFYTSSFWGMASLPFARRNVLKIPSFLILVNLSILVAWYRYLKGERVNAWEPSRRKGLTKVGDLPLNL